MEIGTSSKLRGNPAQKSTETVIFAYFRIVSHILSARFARFAHLLHVFAQSLHAFATFCKNVEQNTRKRAKIDAKTCKTCAKTCRTCANTCKTCANTRKRAKMRENHGLGGLSRRISKTYRFPYRPPMCSADSQPSGEELEKVRLFEVTLPRAK